MKQILILSGKGGTGKTTVASAFIRALKPLGYADCDVDAPNLHLSVPLVGKAEKKEFFGLEQFKIDPNQCIHCGLCQKHCRFSAVSKKDTYHIDLTICEGCGVCAYVCPVHAISPTKNETGETIKYIDEKRLFSTARLNVGKGNSGLLVSEVKKPLDGWEMPEQEIAILDGSPGMGCPVIASLRGVDYVVMVVEPSISSLSDLKRLLKTVHYFRLPVGVVINKANLSEFYTKQIVNYCQKQAIRVLGQIPYDKKIVFLMNKYQHIIESQSRTATALHQMIQSTLQVVKSL